MLHPVYIMKKMKLLASFVLLAKRPLAKDFLDELTADKRPAATKRLVSGRNFLTAA